MLLSHIEVPVEWIATSASREMHIFMHWCCSDTWACWMLCNPLYLGMSALSRGGGDELPLPRRSLIISLEVDFDDMLLLHFCIPTFQE
jgi:hypothetical protein